MSTLVGLLAPRGRMDLRCLFGRGWAAPHEGVGPWRAPFHIVLRGSCELWLPKTRQGIELPAGSLLILPRGAEHVLRAGPKREHGTGIRLFQGDWVDVKTNVAGPGQVEVEILCGEFEFGGRRRSALLDALPEHLVIRFAERPEFGWLEGLVRLMAHEVEQQRPGAAAIVAELSSALFTLAMRAHLDAQPEHSGVLGLMRNPRLAPALKAMLEQPELPWTVESMAALCHLSRASFAREVRQQAGAGPLALLTSLRMELASRHLAQGDRDTASIGEAVGYRSEAAFNRAFTRHAGVPPGRFRRAAAARVAEAAV